MVKSRNVPGQAEGYYLQETRFFYHLLKARSGDKVFLETFGDVATVHSDGSITAEEDKSVIENNPVTDRSVNLWKTFYNWILSIKEGDLKIDQTAFVIYVPRPDFNGKIIEEFNNSSTFSDAITVLGDIKTQFWGEAPKFLLKNKLPESISKYIETLLSDEELTAKVIVRFKYERGECAGYSEINDMIKDSFVPDEHLEIYKKYMIGWIKEKIDILISMKKPAHITRDEFVDESKKYLRKLNREDILQSVSTVPTDDKIQSQIEKKPTYIRQLDLINLEFGEKLNAVCDFLRAIDDRYYWIEKGFIHRSSAEAFEGNLLRTWINIKGEVKATHSSLPQCSQGAAVYFKCKQHNTKIENYYLQPFIISGTYHFLADKPLLGWHPDWEKLITENKTNGKK